MTFKEKYSIIHCKDGSYNKEFCSQSFMCILLNKTFYWKGYLIHKVNGPAIEYYSGSKEWWLNGQLHRKDGPAIERFNKNFFWYLYGERYSKEEFFKVLKLKNSKRVLDDI
jgi:hypothetical protein